MKIERFEDIEGWKLARDLVLQVYQTSGAGRFRRDGTLVDQIRRAASSIMHNIAEGFDGGSTAEFIRFLGYAYRSCNEVQSQLYVAFDQAYVSEERFFSLYNQAAAARGKIGAFIKYLRRYNA